MKKKLLLAALALVLVIAMTVAGTLAFLKEESESVTNTFIAAGGGKLIDDPEDPDPTPDDPYDDNGFYLLEHGIEADDLGVYTQTDDIVDGNEYKVLPGVDLPKDPYLNIIGKTEVAAYLYVEVVDGLGEDSPLSYELAGCWADTGLTGDNGGKIYVYSGADGAILVTDDVTVSILKDNKIVVADDAELDADAELALDFYGYLAQASAGDGAAAAFTACFG